MERFVHASTISPDPFRLAACAVPQRCRQSHKDTRVDDLHAGEKGRIEDEGRFCFVLRARCHYGRGPLDSRLRGNDVMVVGMT